ncbi:MAG TPA: type II toxin-antitoxin system prevent-host-death family antitoxin [Planctomycetota bacterium]|nr:type II toxin-antitoxin system prevent-host-death family antitoxin [Planctomycetota bacterium]
MKQVSYGVRDFQANLGEALRAAERGDRVVITSRGRAVAILARPDGDEPGDSPEERRRKRLAAEGKLKLGKRGIIPPYTLPRVSGLARQLEADRR